MAKLTRNTKCFNNFDLLFTIDKALSDIIILLTCVILNSICDMIDAVELITPLRIAEERKECSAACGRRKSQNTFPY